MSMDNAVTGGVRVDVEIDAIKECMDVLVRLNPEQQYRVAAYLRARAEGAMNEGVPQNPFGGF